MTGKTLGPSATAFFQSRGISPETAVRFEIYSGRHDLASGEVLPDENGNIVTFPYYEHDVLVAEKYRAPGKKFWQRSGGKRTFWNNDVLHDPALEDGRLPLVVTEGEIDALTAIDCGFPLTVSVPDGAPAVKDGESPDDLEPVDENESQTGKFEFMYRNRDALKRIKRFVLAVDSDRPGKRLEAELVRRLHPAKCSFVTYPDGCKDLNDVLKQHGAEAVVGVLNRAKPYPLHGLYRLSDYPEKPELQTYATEWATLNQHFRPWLGEFIVVTGIPGHGKSTWVLQLLVGMAEKHGWRSAIFSPEMPTKPQLRDKLRRIRGRGPIPQDAASLAAIDDWLTDQFFYIGTDPSLGGGDDPDFDVDWIIQRATEAVLRYGSRVLVIDPWNEVEHAKRKDETMTEYHGRSIRALKRFAREREVIVIVIVHPTKEVGKDGKSRPVTLYDVDGSAHWFNKPDHGIIIDRPDPEIHESVIRIAKVRFEESGDKGSVRMKFDRLSSRFEMLAPMEDWS